MEQSSKGIAITLALLLGIFLQVLFAFADPLSQNTPNRAVTEFAEAYFQFDESMGDWLCEDAKTNDDDVDVIDQYIYQAKQEAKARGYSLYYMKEKLYHVETYTKEKKDYEIAKIKLVCERKPPLQSFFTGRSYKIDVIFDVIYDKENRKWKVCGNPFSLLEG